MNTVQLTNDMTRNKYVKKIFKGVFPADKLPKRIKKPALLIANTDPSNKPGKHWVAFFIPKFGPVEFFNSIGKAPEQQEFIKFLKNNGKSFIYNKKRLQGMLSTTCGNYCGIYLYYRSKKIPFKKFLNLFSTSDFYKNDEKILRLYSSIFDNHKQAKAQTGGNHIICNQTCHPCDV